MLSNANLSPSINHSKHVFLLVVVLCVAVVSLFQIQALFAIYSNQGFEIDRTMSPAVLTTMAQDLVDGIFYRPLFGPHGYGGTRYMPLYFILQAGLMKLGFTPMVASWCLSIFSLTALLSSVYFVLRQLHVERPLACAGTLYVLLSSITQLVFSTMRLDMLAVAFNLTGIGLALYLINHPQKRLLPCVALVLCFVLAFFTKVSMIHGFIAVVLFLALNNQRRLAFFITLTTTGLFAFAFVACQIASHGEFLTSFATTGSANGSLGNLIRAPFTWFKHCLQSPGSLFVILLAWSGLISGVTVLKRDLISLFLLFTSLVVLLLFSSPGVSHNHILDLAVIAVIYLIVRINNAEMQPKLTYAYMMIAVVISTGLLANELSDKAQYYRNATKLSQVQRLLADHKVLTQQQDPGPILADNPWLPLLMKEKPYVLDQFMLGVVNDKNPDSQERFRKQIEQQFFRAVVIENPQVQLTDPKRAERYMGCELTKELLQHYQIAGKTGLGIVMVRKERL